MKFLGLTQRTADWLMGKAGISDALLDILSTGSREIADLQESEFVEGPIRLSATGDSELVCFWNTDYLSGTGDESWGFVKLDPPLGILGRADISREVLERSVYVINQRLQGYFIDGAFIHRAYSNGSHTCLAGRGTEARKVSIAYVERDVQSGGTVSHALLSVGPEYDLVKLSEQSVEVGKRLEDLTTQAFKLIAPGRRRLVAGQNVLKRLRDVVAPYTEVMARPEYSEVSVPTKQVHIKQGDPLRTYGWTFREWLSPDSPLSEVQRRLLDTNALTKHPIRIVGPGGSGKTLLMQLLALRQLESARDLGRGSRILYLVHNAKMAESVKHRFAILQGDHPITSKHLILEVKTLSEYGQEQLSLGAINIIDPDAHEAKEFQLDVLSGAVERAIQENEEKIKGSNLFLEVKRNAALFPVLVRLVMAEISVAIKGHGLANDARRYIESERRLSRLHAVLTHVERTVVFEAYQHYHEEMFEGYGVLDSDDVALSLLGKLRTPIWELKRREIGFDHVFVDETQLFNENERRILPLLTKGDTAHVPIVLALDEAQDPYGQTTGGLASLGITNITNESLSSIHRSTRAIVRLAFFVIQRSTELFGPEFPDLAKIADAMEPDGHPLAAKPYVERSGEVQTGLGRFVVKQLRALRKHNLRRLAVICHAEQFWGALIEELRKTDLPIRILENRGERLASDQPIVAVSRPAQVGGQEFDAVILVGLEQGVVPPRVIDNDALATAVEQQTLREVYLAITRARFRVVIALSKGASLTPILVEAVRAGLLTDDSGPFAK